ncbi:MAG: divergent polysaccharide deacetylase family protein [Candidatus Latescibacteria bacterium]|jgi:hypothetical protein|nr:divergent polysaccharide deacetylase family protein [Candidatus Latescibacterota bacterium]MDP7449418.1 divergent polysaccharide deacetylase family protein [Candidatus Latescibacterota bacterium]HJP31394.1 divergent polysaccharide deacetylase family protein [Candidatus Latescibacterota bacterium]
MVKKRRPPQWHLVFTGTGLLAAVIVAVFVSQLPPPPTADEPTELRNLAPPSRIQADAGSFGDSLVARLDTVLFELGISPSWVEFRAAPAGEVDTIAVRVPRDLPVASVNRQITEFVRWHGGYIVRGVERRGPAAVDLTVGIDSTVTTFFRLRLDRSLQRRSGHIAIVVDLAAAPASRLRRLAQLAQPLTLAADGDAAVPPNLTDAGHQLVDRIPDGAIRLDEQATIAEVTRRLWSLAEKAGDAGQVVAATRLLPSTLGALEVMLPRLERRGHRFVTLAELER